MKIFKSILFLVIIGSVFYLGLWLGEARQVVGPAPHIAIDKEAPIDLSLFWETYQKLEQKYIDKGELDPQTLLYGAIRGMVKSLQDPYTVFFEPKESKRFLEDVTGEFEGVGMEIGIKKGELLVIAPLEGTPAFKAGIKAGDKIVKIDEKPALDITIEEAVNLIRGKKGTTVVLTIFREGWKNTKDFPIIRETIKIPSLKWELLASSPAKDKGEEPDIAYLKLYQFTERADFDFRKAAVEILNSPAQKMILDLRNNPGGYLQVAQNIAGWFLKRGEIVAIEDFGGGSKKEYKSPGPAKLLSYPLVVLINQGSASGSEILAAALRDNRGVKLIGEKSFGKGSVQEVERLSDASSLKITVAKWLTPKGQLINGVGLEPDIKVEMTDKDFEEDRDPQLDKAIEVIRSLQ